MSDIAQQDARPPPPASQVARLAVTAAAYLAAQQFARMLIIEPEHVPAFWPAAGVAFAAFVRSAPREWLALALALAAADLLGTALAGAALADAAPHLTLLVGMGGAWLYGQWSPGDMALGSRRSVVAFLGVAILGAAALASLDAYVRHVAAGASIGSVWLADAAGTIVGIVLIAAPLLDWRWVTARRRASVELGELAGLLVAVAALSAAAFYMLDPRDPLSLIAVLAPIPLIAWTSVRLSRGEAALLLLVMATVGFWATMHGRGPISALPGPAAHNILWLQAILTVGSITTLLLSAAVADARRSEASVQRAAALLKSVIETSPEAVITTDAHGAIQSFSQAAERLFGYAADEVLGRNVKQLMPPHFRSQHDGYIKRYLDTGERRIIGIGRVVAGQRKDGSTFPMELSVGEAKAGGQRVFTGFIRDLSEQQRAEKRIQEIQAELFHMSRLSDMGQFASALAHEVNQPLAAIANYTQAVRHLAASDAPDRSGAIAGVLAKLDQQAVRAAEIIRRLRGFIEKHPVECGIDDVNKVIEEALALALIGVRAPDLRIHLDLEPDLPLARIDRVHIQQVVVNLVRNAREAMTASPRREIVITSKASGGAIEVAVADSGPGLAPEVLAKLFQPFITTKVDGMGVGLSICRSIIEAHAGRLWYEPSPSGGATFRFTVQIADVPTAEDAEQPAK